MTIEDFFLNDYKKIKETNIELEKKCKLLQIENDKSRHQLKEIVSFLKLGRPYDTGSDYGFFLMTYWLSGQPKEKATRLLKKLGVDIEQAKEQE